MTTRHLHPHIGKENAGDLPQFKTAKTAGKEGLKEGK